MVRAVVSSTGFAYMLPNRMVINAIQINDLRFIVEMFVIIRQRYNLFTIWQSRAKGYDFFENRGDF